MNVPWHPCRKVSTIQQATFAYRPGCYRMHGTLPRLQNVTGVHTLHPCIDRESLPTEGRKCSICMLPISYSLAKVRKNYCNSVAKLHDDTCMITCKCFYLNIIRPTKKILPTSKQT